MNHGEGRRWGDGTRATRNAGARTALRTLTASVLLTAVSMLGATQMPAAQESPTQQNGAYRFGVFPYLPAAKIDSVFGPATLDLAEHLGVEVHLRTKSTFERFADELARESYDFVFVHPFFYIEAHDHHNYLPLARLDESLTGVAMVAEDSPLREASDLRGRTVALPPPLAAVSEMAAAALIAAGLRPGHDVTLRHYHSKTSCLRAVASEAAACVIPVFLLNQLSALEEMRLRPLFETPAIHSAVFAVHERVPEPHRRALRARILGWPDTAPGRRILAPGAWTRFVEARDEDYDDLRRYRARLRARGDGVQQARR